MRGASGLLRPEVGCCRGCLRLRNKELVLQARGQFCRFTLVKSARHDSFESSISKGQSYLEHYSTGGQHRLGQGWVVVALHIQVNLT